MLENNKNQKCALVIPNAVNLTMKINHHMESPIMLVFKGAKVNLFYPEASGFSTTLITLFIFTMLSIYANTFIF